MHARLLAMRVQEHLQACDQHDGGAIDLRGVDLVGRNELVDSRSIEAGHPHRFRNAHADDLDRWRALKAARPLLGGQN